MPHPSDTEPSDAELAAAAQRDPAAFDGLYRRYLPRVYKFCAARLPSSQDAEDVTSAVFIEAIGALKGYSEQGRFPAWLFTIARRQAQSFRRRSQPTVGLEAAGETLARSPGTAATIEELHRVQSCLDTLEEEARDAIALRYFADLPVLEVAAVMGKGESATKMLLHRALRQMRRHLEVTDG